MSLGRYTRLKEQQGGGRNRENNSKANKRLTWLSHSWEEVEDEIGP